MKTENLYILPVILFSFSTILGSFNISHNKCSRILLGDSSKQYFTKVGMSTKVEQQKIFLHIEIKRNPIKFY
jgi:hypothetical protein